MEYIKGIVICNVYSKMFPNNCAVNEKDGEGKGVGPCTFHLKDGVCPRHGRVQITTLKCFKCKSVMIESKALKDIIDVITPDFVGQPKENARKSGGQTMSPTGEAEMIDVYKCSECGFSITK